MVMAESGTAGTPRGRFLLRRGDVATVPTSTGVWVGHADGSFTVGGEGSAALVDRLLELADGNRDAAAVLSAAGDVPTEVGTALLSALTARRCLVELPHRLEDLARAHGPLPRWFLPSVAGLDARPVAALGALLEARVVVLGRRPWYEELRPHLDRAGALEGRTAHLPWPASALPGLEGHRPTVAVLDADAAPRAEVRAAQSRLVAAGITHSVVGGAGGRTWVAWTDASGTTCWSCLAEAADAASDDRPTPEHPERAWPIVLCHELVLRCAGLGTPAVTGVAHAPARGTGITTATAAGARRCRCGTAVATDPVDGPSRAATVRPDVRVPSVVGSPEAAASYDGEVARIIAALSAWTDPLLGPFLRLDADSGPQVPLASATAVHLEAGSAGAARYETRVVTVSSREAIHQAALCALERLASPGAGGPGTVSAGWSPDEAVYRAHLRRALADAPDAGAMLPVRSDLLHDSPCGAVSGFLAEVAGRDDAHLHWRTDRTESGLHRVVALDADSRVVRRGAGLCGAEALGMALLSGHQRATGGHLPLVPLAPHATTWDEVWSLTERPEHTTVHPIATRFAASEVSTVVAR